MPTPALSLPVNHVFVDVENVQLVEPDLIGRKSVSFTLLLGEQQKKLPVGLVEKMMDHVASVQIIRLAKPGKNALDFALTYYLGQAVQSDPMGFFHLISKDKGYDPLIEHLRSRHVRVRRHDDYTTLTFAGQSEAAHAAQLPAPKPAPPAKAKVTIKAPAPAKPKPPTTPQSARLSFEELQNRVLAHLRSEKSSRPTRQKTLKTYLMKEFGQETTESAVLKLIEKWRAEGRIEAMNEPNTDGHYKIKAYKL